MTEEWKPVFSNDRYFVSSSGMIRNKKGHVLAFAVNKKGYYRVFLHDENGGKYHFVHRVVAKSFISNPDNKPQVNHKNSIKTDNSVLNLEWCTNQENQNHAVLNGLKPMLKGSKNGMSKLNEQKVLEIRSKLLSWTGYTASMLAAEYGVSVSRINGVKYKRNWTHV